MGESQAAGRTPERIGVLGGTFDPIHLGHLAMARAALEAHRLDRMLLVPASIPPHKSGELTPFHHRLEMARLAAQAAPGLAASDIEGRRRGPSFTVDTLAELKREHPRAEVFFIIGEDTIPELPLWRDLPRIMTLARIVAVNRPGPRRDFHPVLFPGLAPRLLERCEEDRVEMPPSPISSREVRGAIRACRPFDQWLPTGVADYIRRHGLYQNGGDR